MDFSGRGEGTQTNRKRRSNIILKTIETGMTIHVKEEEGEKEKKEKVEVVISEGLANALGKKNWKLRELK